MLERWIADRPFQEACPPGQSDLDIARGTHAREILQGHWRNWITESDWAWLAETGINTVRIPVSLMTFSETSHRPFCLHFSGSLHSLSPCVSQYQTCCQTQSGSSLLRGMSTPSRFSRALACSQNAATIGAQWTLKLNTTPL